MEPTGGDSKPADASTRKDEATGGPDPGREPTTIHVPPDATVTVTATATATGGDSRTTAEGVEAGPGRSPSWALLTSAECRASYRDFRFHAAGGLGEVYRATGDDLNREVALKFLKSGLAGDAELRRRFLLEAEVTGRLEHPGVVPVYGLGVDPDGSPCYAMRLIRGETLHDAIAAFHAADDPGRDDTGRAMALRSLLRRFLSVCNTVAYAHSRGVIHRDLKPRNVMLGKFDETLVVDWGLAKATGRPDGEADAGAMAGEEALAPSSGRSGPGVPTVGAVGTPQYMSPEQAEGRPDVGPASDVYGLGATLYAILTGRAPFEGKGLREILGRVRLGDFPSPRRVKPSTPPALEAICLKAMALRPEGRYASALDLAFDVERWLADEPVSAWREPWHRRLGRWSRRHRTALAAVATASAVAAGLLIPLAWSRVERRRRAEATASLLVEHAEGVAAEARASNDPAGWLRAVAEAQRTVDQLHDAGGDPSAPAARLREFQAEEAQLRADLRTAATLAEARIRFADYRDQDSAREALDAYQAAFAAYGLDLATMPVEAAIARVRRSRIAADLVDALQDMLQAATLGEKPLRDKLMAIAFEADADPNRNVIRYAPGKPDVAAIRRVCADEDGRKRLGPRLRLAFQQLGRYDPVASLPLLEAILRENPADFWMNYEMGHALRRAKARPEEVVRRFSVAVALRPDSTAARFALGNALGVQGRLDEAIAEYREVIRREPDYPLTYGNLGEALRRKGKLEEAIPLYRETLRRQPSNVIVRNNLANVLGDLGRDREAEDEYREAIRTRPAYAEAHYNLANALKKSGRLDEAEARYREAIQLKPDYWEARNNLANLLAARGRYDEASEQLREAIRIRPDHEAPHNSLGNLLAAQGRRDEAVAEYREAIKLRPAYPEAYNGLGVALTDLGRLGEAEAACREAIKLRPAYAEAHCALGRVLLADGRFEAALRSLERGHELGSPRPGWKAPSAAWVGDARRLRDLEARALAILRGEAKPSDVDDRLALADACARAGRHAAAARFYAEALAESPGLADDPNRAVRIAAARSAAPAGSGRGRDDPPPDATARAQLREQARAWLGAELQTRAKGLPEGDPGRRREVAEALARWKSDPGLAGVRDQPELAKLPEAERRGWEDFWAEVDRALAQARPGGP